MKIDRLTKPKIENVEAKVIELLEALGFDTRGPDLKDTCRRIARMYVNELLVGHYNEPPKMTFFPRNGYGKIVLLKDIAVRSLCSHHMLPFFGHAHIAYIPNERIIGISKLARLTQYYAKRLQTQENLTEQIAAHLNRELAPKGVIVLVEATHMCMQLRGAREHDTEMVTLSYFGEFANEKLREEFMSLIRKKK